MRDKIFKAGVFISVVALLLTALLGCGQSEPSETLPEPDYASEAIEITLQGLSENSLEKYTRYSNPEFKAAVTQDILDKTATQITGQLGTYESKEFLYAEKQDVYILVHYKVKFTKGEVGVRMVFDASGKVAGQWFE